MADPFDRVNGMFSKTVATQRLTYLDDTYLTEVECLVVAVEPAGELRVDVCLFHPQGGGQPADRGWIDGVEVAPVRDPSVTTFSWCRPGARPPGRRVSGSRPVWIGSCAFSTRPCTPPATSSRPPGAASGGSSPA